MDIVEKLNVNKHLFCVKKRQNLQYFLISSMKILKIRKFFLLILSSNNINFVLQKLKVYTMHTYALINASYKNNTFFLNTIIFNIK